MATPADKEEHFKYTTYADFTDVDIDPSKDSEAVLLRSGLIYPNNPALIPQKYYKNGRNDNPNDGMFVKKLYRCYLCTQQYSSRESLNKHIKIRHLKNNTDIKDLMRPKWYCSTCKKEFAHNISAENNYQVTHFCINGTQKVDQINSNEDEADTEQKTSANGHDNALKLCSINSQDPENAHNPLLIKRIRFECRKNNELGSIEQWLKYELIKRELTRNDYLNAARMFIAVQGYRAAIQLLHKSQAMFTEHVINTNNSNNSNVQDADAEDQRMEQTLIDIAKKLQKHAK